MESDTAPDEEPKESGPGPTEPRPPRRGLTATVVVVAVILIGAVAGIAATSGSSAKGYDTDPEAFVLPALDGHGNVRLAEYSGKPLVVNFFASWCTECAKELPGFAAEARALRGKVNFIEVNALETGNGPAFAKRFGLYGAVSAVARDVGGSQGSGLYNALGGTNTMPLTALYSAGRPALEFRRALSQAQLVAEIDQFYSLSAPS